MENKHRKQTLAFCLGIILVGCLIQAAGQIRGDRLVFPDVPGILRAFFRLLGQRTTWRAVWITVRHLLQALVISSLIGTAVGAAESRSAFCYALLRPMMTLLRSLPMIVMVVVIMVLTRYEYVPLTAACLLLVPLISEAVCEGLRSIDPELIDVYRMNSSLNLRVLFRVYLPLTAGFLRQAYMNAVGMGLKLIISAEYLVQTKGSLGKAVYSSSYFNEYEDIYAYALIMILLVLLVSEAPSLISKTAQCITRRRRA